MCTEKGEVAFVMAHVFVPVFWDFWGTRRWLLGGDINVSRLLLFLSGLLETAKPFCHCVVQRNETLAWKSMPEMVFCFARSAKHHTADFFLAGQIGSLLHCEVRVPKVEGKETNELISRCP